MKLQDLQDTVRDTIKAVDLFAIDLVISDLGLQQIDMEKALNDRGFCIAVSPILNGGSSTDSQGIPVNISGEAALMLVRFIVSVRTNPTRNYAEISETDTGGANINPLTAVSEVIRALKSWSNQVNKTEKRFEVDGDNALTIAEDDPGILTWDIRFRKTATT